jgi:predicted amidohydrolase
MSNHLRTALIQMSSTPDMSDNLAVAEALIHEAVHEKARFVLTPEVTALMEPDRDRLLSKVVPEEEDVALARLRAIAADAGIWLLIGSLAVKAGPDKVANRSFLVDDKGRIVSRYDKIHLFDVDLGDGTDYRESRTYEAGRAGRVAETPWGKLGLSICYDLRFPQLYRAYGQAGAAMIAVPSAFTRTTGEAHWHVLLRARAIETGAYVLAPAQCGVHISGRETYGHSLIVDPWGRVVGDGGSDPGVVVADLDFDEVAKMRRRIPSLMQDVAFELK